MTDFRERYKRVGYGREDPDINRALRSQRREEARREMRSEHFSLMRNVPNGDEDDSLNEREHEDAGKLAKGKNRHREEKESKKNDDEAFEEAIQKRLLELERWREERKRQKIEEKKKAKPAFKVGVVHHRVYSPPLIKDPIPPPPPKLCRTKEVHHPETPPKKVTRATEKRLAIKAMVKQQKREKIRSKKEKEKKKEIKDELHMTPLAPKDHQFKAPSGITAIPMFGRHALKVTKDNLQFEVNSSNVSSTTNDFLEHLSNNSPEPNFSSSNHSIILSKSRYSNARKSMLHHSDSSVNKIINDSMNNSSVEAVTLRLSVSDEEEFNNADNTKFNHTNSPISKRRSSRIFKPSIVEQTLTNTKEMANSDDYEMKEDHTEIDSNSTVNISHNSTISKKTKTRRKSSKFTAPVAEINSTDETKVTEMLDNEMIVDQNDSIEADSTITNRIKTKRRSSKYSTLSKSNTTDENEIINTKIQEMVEAENNVSFSKRNNAKSPANKRKSSAEISISKDETMKDENFYNDNDSFSRHNKTESPVHKKRSRMSLDETVDSEKRIKSASFSVGDKKTFNSQENNDIKSTSFSIGSNYSKENKFESPIKLKRSSKLFTDELSNTEEVVKQDNFIVQDQEKNSPLSRENKRKSLGRRKSIRIHTSNNEDETVEDSPIKETKITSPEDRKTSKDQENSDSELTNSILIDSSLTREKNKKTNRKSFTLLNNEKGNMEKSQNEDSFTFETQDIEKNEDVDSNKNFMDSSFTQQNEIKSSERRKSIKIGESTMHLQKSPFVKILPLVKQPKNSAHSKSLNESSSSEPTKRKTPEKLDNDVQNSSLNMSLPENSTQERPPAFFSPYIVASRGKKSERKEMHRRRFSQISPNDIPTKETVMQNLNISVEEEEHTAQYYKYILNQEIERLNERCDRWNIIKEDDATPEDIHYMIQAAVGQTQLLINKKFERFRRLVLDCETGKGEMLVTSKDLQGFWEMMYMEIKDCDNRFNKLEVLKDNNWVDEESEEAKQMAQPKKKKAPLAKKVAAKKKPVAAKSSSLRAHIMAARKKKMESKDSEVDTEMNVVPTIEQNERLQSNDKRKSLNNNTPVKSRRTSTPKSNKWQSLLKKVQLSQTRKSTTSPLIVMKLGQMCKTPEVHLDDSIIYINSDRTPAKSILKTSKEDAALSSAVKAANKVFFKDHHMEIEYNAEKNKDEGMCLDDINEFKEPIERKLNFEDDSFNSSDLKNNQDENKNTETNLKHPTVSLSPFNTTTNKDMVIPDIVITEESPLISMSPLNLGDSKTSSSSIKKSNTKAKKISFMDNADESYTRTLRSNTFTAPLTPRPKIKNFKKIDEDSIMEIDENMEEDDDSIFTVPEPPQLKELYMNEQGVVCERIIPAKKATPRLRRSNSEKQKNIRSNEIKESNRIDRTPSTPRLRRTNSYAADTRPHSPVTLANETIEESKRLPSTPRLRRQSSKRPTKDTILTDDQSNITTEQNLTPKMNRKTFHAIRTDLNESVNQGATPRLRRTNSRSQTNFEKSSEVSTPRLKRRTLKKLQENVEPNEQEPDESINENVKVSRISSLKRRNSKKYTQDVEGSELQTDFSEKRSQALTPNNRRKSLRIAQVNVGNED